MENLGIFYDHLVYFTAIGNILLPFGIFCGNWVYFSPSWYFGPRKIWQPWIGLDVKKKSCVCMCRAEVTLQMKILSMPFHVMKTADVMGLINPFQKDRRTYI
jgi:hypothetical protein